MNAQFFINEIGCNFILLFIERNKCNVYLIIAQIFHTTIF